MNDNVIKEHFAQGKAVLKVDLGLVRQNYLALRKLVDHQSVLGASVKANAYGLGANRIAVTLMNSGCCDFFVANLEEAMALRQYLNEYSENTKLDANINPNIYVLNGVYKGYETELKEHNLQPVLNSLDQLSIWQEFCKKEYYSSYPQPRTISHDSCIKRTRNQYSPNANKCILHLNTGMSRLGMPEYEYFKIIEDPALLDYLDITLVMSHLSSSDEPSSPENRKQLDKFNWLIDHSTPNGANVQITQRLVLPNAIKIAKKSLANSGGIFLGKDYHFDLLRPGAAIYGIQPHPNAASYISNPLSLYAPIIQVHNISKGETLGYNASFIADKDMRIAILPIGYADGYMRALGGKSCVYIDGKPSIVLGKVSMDLLCIDVTNIEPSRSLVGSVAEIIGPNQTPDNLAKVAGTIGYEIITSLGARYERVYTEYC